MTAQFMNQVRDEPLHPMNDMGKPLSFTRREVAFKHCRDMGLDSAGAFECVSAMAESLERDNPFDAMKVGMRFLDLVGTYRCMAALLSNEMPDTQPQGAKSE